MFGTRRTFLLRGMAAAAAVTAHAATRALARRRNKTARPRPLFQDRFLGGDRLGWGSPWLNQRYNRHWAQRGHKGVYRLPPSETNMAYRPNPVLVLDHDVAAVDITATVSRTNETGRMGLVARAGEYANYYACYVANDNLRVVRCSHHDEHLFAKKELRGGAAAKYRIRLQVKGGDPVYIRAKVWRYGYPEPAGWTISVVDSSKHALVERGPFGLLFMHAADGRGCTFKVSDIVAWSGQRPAKSNPDITFAFAGVAKDRIAKVVTKTAVPGAVTVEYGPEPTLTQSPIRVAAGRTNRKAGTTTAPIDVSGFAGGTTVYWRSVARRGSAVSVGPVSSFRVPAAEGLPVRFAFGACTRWNAYPRPSFDQIRRRLPDFFLHQGDFGYVSNRALAHAPDCYHDHWTRMIVEDNFTAMTREVPILLTRDDEEYGGNDANRNTRKKFSAYAHGAMHANPSNRPFDFRYGDIHFFNIDCRRYATGKSIADEKRTKLGDRQKRWLKQRMREVAKSGEAGLLIVCSPVAFGSDFSPASWRRTYATEWAELIDFFDSLDAAVLIVSGDAHGHRIHEYPQKSIPTNLPRVLEFQSAGTEQNRWSDGIDRDILVKRSKGPGFGLVEIGPEQETNGQRVRTLTLTAVRSEDGSAHWPPSNYLIVRGVGILPAG
ncbi:MAG TPA: alkaline phosphatase D family protein [Actinomycetota bacterium]|nr:alkaline phosphatase D family protein [Actinomycetota bacterium]